ncbi:MAG: GNAT family N-acetyltransferase [Robiginitomaculum sp.]|nr:GNAT family N-acetyltransferase [Robiginitomaculum sp.]
MSNIKTPRLVLRPFTMKDAPRLCELIAEPEIISMMEQPPWPYTLADAELWLRGLPSRKERKQAYCFAIEIPRTGIIGGISLQKKNSDLFDLGFWVGKDYWGKGYANEAAQAIMAWGVNELALTKITVGYFQDNPASGKLLQKLGFVATGKACPINNPLRDKPVACLGMIWTAQ